MITETAPSPIHGWLRRVGEALQGFDVDAAERLRATLANLGNTVRPVTAAMSPTCDWLAATLGARPPRTAVLIDALVPLIPRLYWQEGPRPGAPAGFDGGYAYVLLTGPDGQIHSDDCRVGLYLQRPGLHYPAHAHEAEEFYLVLSGTADWRAGDRSFAAAPGQLIHHAPGEPHEMTTHEAPLLAFFAWLGKIEGDYWFL